jgi:hypothetical protein
MWKRFFLFIFVYFDYDTLYLQWYIVFPHEKQKLTYFHIYFRCNHRHIYICIPHIRSGHTFHYNCTGLGDMDSLKITKG